jgi:ubiquitin carboxyl-terminal hydrolase 48
VLLAQRNITERAQLESSLSELTEAQLAMMSQIFPRHVIEALSVGNKEDLDIELVAKMARSHMDVTVLFMGECWAQGVEA